jgi:sugar diacid utilization regulator
MIEEQLGLSHITVHQILTVDLEMRKICVKMVPKMLSQDQKDNRKDWCLDFLEQIENNHSFLEWRRVLGFRVRPRNKALELRMAHIRFTEVKRRKNEQVKNQNDADLLLLQPGNNFQGVCTSWPNSQPTLL